ncbi:uncharacterized protein AB675_11235 [Cyphellophora attinorum]|uniref:Uncharacterized protein n=1 Tax=Cyphellophora attinorum TaxID=1664694 RepID=A0A0N1P150_9EURO|nr:uncharacterized protein AB675_11235 [Phialophora attinorum]KPI40083.1 hypothetical protein AB675_11235 [Phialophora attinorum]
MLLAFAYALAAIFASLMLNEVRHLQLARTIGGSGKSGHTRHADVTSKVAQEAPPQCVVTSSSPQPSVPGDSCIWVPGGGSTGEYGTGTLHRVCNTSSVYAECVEWIKRDPEKMRRSEEMEAMDQRVRAVGELVSRQNAIDEKETVNAVVDTPSDDHPSIFKILLPGYAVWLACTFLLMRILNDKSANEHKEADRKVYAKPVRACERPEHKVLDKTTSEGSIVRTHSPGLCDQPAFGIAFVPYEPQCSVHGKPELQGEESACAANGCAGCCNARYLKRHRPKALDEVFDPVAIGLSSSAGSVASKAQEESARPCWPIVIDAVLSADNHASPNQHKSTPLEAKRDQSQPSQATKRHCPTVTVTTTQHQPKPSPTASAESSTLSQGLSSANHSTKVPAETGHPTTREVLRGLTPLTQMKHVPNPEVASFDGRVKDTVVKSPNSAAVSVDSTVKNVMTQSSTSKASSFNDKVKDTVTQVANLLEDPSQPCFDPSDPAVGRLICLPWHLVESVEKLATQSVQPMPLTASHAKLTRHSTIHYGDQAAKAGESHVKVLHLINDIQRAKVQSMREHGVYHERRKGREVHLTSSAIEALSEARTKINDASVGKKQKAEEAPGTPARSATKGPVKVADKPKLSTGQGNAAAESTGSWRPYRETRGRKMSRLEQAADNMAGSWPDHRTNIVTANIRLTVEGIDQAITAVRAAAESQAEFAAESIKLKAELVEDDAKATNEDTVHGQLDSKAERPLPSVPDNIAAIKESSSNASNATDTGLRSVIPYETRNHQIPTRIDTFCPWPAVLATPAPLTHHETRTDTEQHQMLTRADMLRPSPAVVQVPPAKLYDTNAYYMHQQPTTARPPTPYPRPMVTKPTPSQIDGLSTGDIWQHDNPMRIDDFCPRPSVQADSTSMKPDDTSTDNSREQQTTTTRDPSGPWLTAQSEANWLRLTSNLQNNTFDPYPAAPTTRPWLEVLASARHPDLKLNTRLDTLGPRSTAPKIDADIDDFYRSSPPPLEWSRDTSSESRSDSDSDSDSCPSLVDWDVHMGEISSLASAQQFWNALDKLVVENDVAKNKAGTEKEGEADEKEKEDQKEQKEEDSKDHNSDAADDAAANKPEARPVCNAAGSAPATEDDSPYEASESRSCSLDGDFQHVEYASDCSWDSESPSVYPASAADGDSWSNASAASSESLDVASVGVSGSGESENESDGDSVDSNDTVWRTIPQQPSASTSRVREIDNSVVPSVYVPGPCGCWDAECRHI